MREQLWTGFLIKLPAKKSLKNFQLNCQKSYLIVIQTKFITNFQKKSKGIAVRVYKLFAAVTQKIIAEQIYKWSKKITKKVPKFFLVNCWWNFRIEYKAISEGILIKLPEKYLKPFTRKRFRTNTSRNFQTNCWKYNLKIFKQIQEEFEKIQRVSVGIYKITAEILHRGITEQIKKSTKGIHE